MNKNNKLLHAELFSDSTIGLFFESLTNLSDANLKDALKIYDNDGTQLETTKVTINSKDELVIVHLNTNESNFPYTVDYFETTKTAGLSWRYKDDKYAYDGKLGLTLKADGSANLKLWSPSADSVNVILYDKDDQNKVIADHLAMIRLDRGVWSINLNQDNTNIVDLTGYYYHFAIDRNGKTVIALDPYAKSLATWDDTNPNNVIGKAAIVDPSKIGPKLDYAKIQNYNKREDAIIYEVHIRDFTSDPAIGAELRNPFGTFSAFVEKLDYIKSLGVTHVQLLPVMSYLIANEFERAERLLTYSSKNNNYNWGYDPQSYFALTGMYSENPDDPEQRIAELKNVIAEIHKRGMGVLLDVVYNHTADVAIFENLEPNYYHFMDADGTARIAFKGGRLATTRKMARRILIDSITYWVKEFKVDGFRFDMMGDHDAATIQQAYDEAKALNPDVLMIGEGWITYVGDEFEEKIIPADQHWMKDTESVGSFSDDIRDELKSGYNSEGEPRFLTGGARQIQRIFDNLTANPHNFTATSPGDVVAYIEAHDNMTLHDVIALSIKKDPQNHAEEIHQRIRLGNVMLLTAQGTTFIHAGQEYGRTKQFRHPDFIGRVSDDQVPFKSTYLSDENGDPINYPYFIHDSYDSTDAVNKFEWGKVTDEKAYPIETMTQRHMQGLIALRRSTDAFSRGTIAEIKRDVTLIEAPEINHADLVIGYQAIASDGVTYAVFVNADDKRRQLTLATDYSAGEIIVDQLSAGTEPIADPQGIKVMKDSIQLEPLTATVIRIK